MKAKSRAKLIITSLLAIVCCMSLIAGATFALFTSESKVNIAITSGKVEVVASAENLKTYSGEWNETNKAYDSKETATAGIFTTSGTAEIEGNTLTLEKIVPMDKATLEFKVENKSNVTIKYRTIISVSEDDGLFSGLIVNIGGQVFDGITAVSNWATLEVGSEDAIIPVSVELPESAGNEYQDKSCTITYSVEAVQGNAYTVDLPENVIALYNASDLRTFAKKVNAGTSYTGKVVTLMDDMDLENVEWTPINGAGKNVVFDGNGKTIKNLKVSEGHNAGFFSTGSGCTIKNLTVDGASVTGVGRLGVICGHGMCVIVENCSVKNATVTADPSTKCFCSGCLISDPNGDYNGDKVGAIVGYLSAEHDAKVTGCSAENVTVKGYRDIGGLVGYAHSDDAGNYVITGNTIKNSKIVVDKTNDYKNYKTDEAKYDAHEIVGEQGEKGTVENNTVDNVTFSDIVPVIVEPGKTPTEAVTAAIASAKEGDTVVLPKSETPIKVSSIDKPITIVGDGETKVDASTAGTGVSAPGVTFENVAFYSGNATYNTIRGKATYINCTFDGLVNTYDDSTYIGCTFTNSVSGQYLAHVYAGTALYENCTFIGSDRCVYIYADMSKEASATFNNCTFTMTSVDKSAIMLNSYEHGGSFKYTVVINNCTQTGGNNLGTGSADGSSYDYRGLYGFKHKPVKVMGTVTVDGTVVYSNLAD